MEKMELEATERSLVEAAPARHLSFWRIAWSVFAGMWLFALSVALLFGIRWGVLQAQAQAAAEKQYATEQANEVVRPEFKVQATQVASLIKAEYAASRQGWKNYVASRDAAKSALNNLKSMATTSHEASISQGLDIVWSGFSDCVGEGEHPSDYLSASDCAATYKQSDVDDALNH